MGAGNANDRITFGKKVVLPGEKNITCSFFPPEATTVFCQSDAPQNSLSLVAWGL